MITLRRNTDLSPSSSAVNSSQGVPTISTDTHLPHPGHSSPALLVKGPSKSTTYIRNSVLFGVALSQWLG